VVPKARIWQPFASKINLKKIKSFRTLKCKAKTKLKQDIIRTNLGQIINNNIIMGKWGIPRKESKQRQISKKSK
jgi:hypothetical protein